MSQFILLKVVTNIGEKTLGAQVEEIIDKYADMVYRLALIHMRNNKEDADDIFQDVFLVLINKNKQFNDEEHCKAWLIRVTLNLCKKHHFKRKDITLDEQSINMIREEENMCVMNEESHEIYECICRLPDKYKTVIALFYLEELSCKEIAGYLHIAEAAVRKRLSRAREFLRKEMEEAR